MSSLEYKQAQDILRSEEELEIAKEYLEGLEGLIEKHMALERRVVVMEELILALLAKKRALKK